MGPFWAVEPSRATRSTAIANNSEKYRLKTWSNFQTFFFNHQTQTQIEQPGWLNRRILSSHTPFDITLQIFTKNVDPTRCTFPFPLSLSLSLSLSFFPFLAAPPNSQRPCLAFGLPFFPLILFLTLRQTEKSQPPAPGFEPATFLLQVQCSIRQANESDPTEAENSRYISFSVCKLCPIVMLYTCMDSS